MLGMVRRSDCFGRVGGEEFVLVLPDTSIEEAALIVERMLAVIRNSRPTQGTNRFQIYRFGRDRRRTAWRHCGQPVREGRQGALFSQSGGTGSNPSGGIAAQSIRCDKMNRTSRLCRMGAPEKAFNLKRGHRSGEGKALQHVAPQISEKGCLCHCLDAFGDNFNTKRFPDLHNGCNQP